MIAKNGLLVPAQLIIALGFFRVCKKHRRND